MKVSDTLKTILGAGALAASLLGAPTAALAAEQVVTLSVPGMNCPVCPITVRASLEGVDGVVSAETSLDDRTAIVTFDDAKTNVEALIKATTDYGYPSTPVDGKG